LIYDLSTIGCVSGVQFFLITLKSIMRTMSFIVSAMGPFAKMH